MTWRRHRQRQRQRHVNAVRDNARGSTADSCSVCPAVSRERLRATIGLARKPWPTGEVSDELRQFSTAMVATRTQVNSVFRVVIFFEFIWFAIFMVATRNLLSNHYCSSGWCELIDQHLWTVTELTFPPRSASVRPLHSVLVEFPAVLVYLLPWPVVRRSTRAPTAV